MPIKKNCQRTRTHFLAKYGELYLYDIYMEERYSIDDKGIHFVKEDGYALIVSPYHPDGTSTDHEYFCIYDDSFNRILEIDQNPDITMV